MQADDPHLNSIALILACSSWTAPSAMKAVSTMPSRGVCGVDAAAGLPGSQLLAALLSLTAGVVAAAVSGVVGLLVLADAVAFSAASFTCTSSSGLGRMLRIDARSSGCTVHPQNAENEGRCLLSEAWWVSQLMRHEVQHNLVQNHQDRTEDRTEATVMVLFHQPCSNLVRPNSSD